LEERTFSKAQEGLLVLADISGYMTEVRQFQWLNTCFPIAEGEIADPSERSQTARTPGLTAGTLWRLLIVSEGRFDTSDRNSKQVWLWSTSMGAVSHAVTAAAAVPQLPDEPAAAYSAAAQTADVTGSTLIAE
jgi:hypothetical protein